MIKQLKINIKQTSCW